MRLNNVGLLAFLAAVRSSQGACPNVDPASNGNYVADRVNVEVNTYVELAVGLSALYDDNAKMIRSVTSGVAKTYAQSTEFTSKVTGGQCNLFFTAGVDVGYHAVLPSVSADGLKELKDKMSFPNPEPSEPFTIYENALSIPTPSPEGDACFEASVNFGGYNYQTRIAEDAESSTPSLNYNEFRLFEGTEFMKQDLLTYNYKVAFTDPSYPDRKCIVQPFASVSYNYLAINEENIQCEDTNKFCRKTDGNLVTLFKEYKNFVNRIWKNIKKTFGQWLNGVRWWEKWKLSTLAATVETSLSIFPSGDRVCWEENSDGTYKVTVDHYANTKLGGIFGNLLDLDLPDWVTNLLGDSADFTQRTLATFQGECENMVEYISGV